MEWKPAATEAASAAAAVGSRSSGLRPACSQRSVRRGEEGEAVEVAAAHARTGFYCETKIVYLRG